MSWLGEMVLLSPVLNLTPPACDIHSDLSIHNLLGALRPEFIIGQCREVEIPMSKRSSADGLYQLYNTTLLITIENKQVIERG